MKRLIIMGAILAGVAVSFLLVFANVSTMAKDGSKHAVITVDVETGRIISITDEDGNKPIKVGPGDIDKIYQTTDGFKYVGTILHAQSSPGCVYIMMGGWWFKICR